MPKITHVPGLVIGKIDISPEEAGFLRFMAEHCIKTDMRGSLACERLVELLRRAGIKENKQGPIYGIFEIEDFEPRPVR